MAHADTVVVGVTDVNFNVLFVFVKDRTEALGLIESDFGGGAVFKANFRGFRAAQPGKRLIAEWVYNFNFVIISVSNYDHILLRNKMHS